MPSRLAAPVLTVDAAKMHKVDPRNVESLFGMWTVFSKCAESIEGGRRLENMSWRLWNRETFCCEAQPQLSTTPAIDIPVSRPGKKEMPALSSSVDSISSDETESASSSPSEDSALSRSRGKEKHITSKGLERMVFSIKEQTDLEPLPASVTDSLPTLSIPAHRDLSPAPSPISPTSPQIESMHPSTQETFTNSCTSAVTVDSSRVSEHRDSDTSMSSGGLIRSGSIIHGFAPSPISSSLRARLSPDLTPRSPKKALAGMFTLGGSSGDDESFTGGYDVQATDPETCAPEPTKASRPIYLATAFMKTVVSHKHILPIKEGHDEDEGAIETDDEEIDESAIEDDEDESEWEDSQESNRSSLIEDKTIFKRVDSRANLVSRKSLLTRGLTEQQRAAGLAEAAMKQSVLRRSRTSSPNGPSVPGSPSMDDEHSLASQVGGASKAKPIIYNNSSTQLSSAHSPRTTRRNMLSTELTESLRRHLLWERQQKSTTANAVFKRRHTAQNELTKLQEFPGPKLTAPAVDTSKNNSWNHCFDCGPWEYHARGW